ncbi:MAG: hypothetical protein ACP5PJ_00175 [Acidimicrobiales bacterium]
MSALEGFRRLADYSWDRTAELTDATIQLLWELAGHEQMLFVALRRLLEHHVEVGELWNVAGRVLNGAELGESVTSTYLWWSSHRDDCVLHELPVGIDRRWGERGLVSAWSPSRMVLRDPWGEYSTDLTLESCEARLVPEFVIDRIAAELHDDSGIVVSSIGSDLRDAPDQPLDKLLEESGVPLTLADPFPPRLGR